MKIRLAKRIITWNHVRQEDLAGKHLRSRRDWDWRWSKLSCVRKHLRILQYANVQSLNVFRCIVNASPLVFCVMNGVNVESVVIRKQLKIKSEKLTSSGGGDKIKTGTRWTTTMVIGRPGRFPGSLGIWARAQKKTKHLQEYETFRAAKCKTLRRPAMFFIWPQEPFRDPF